MKTIMPLGDRVLVKPLGAGEDKKNKAGIIIPDKIGKEKPERGKVVAVGEGRWNEDGDGLVPMRVKVGQTVIFSKYSPDEIKIEGEEYFILKEESILAVIK